MKNLFFRACCAGFVAGALGIAVTANAGNDKRSLASAEAKFKAMDTNADGKISVAEHTAGAQHMFGAMDTNSDGQVTATEMDAYAALFGKKNMRDKTSAEKIKAIDTNGDGVLTASEHASGSDAMFGKMDTNGDGFLTSEEMAAGHQMLKKGT